MKCKLCCPFQHTHFKNCLKHDRALAWNRDAMRRAPGSATTLVLSFIKRCYSPNSFLRTHDPREHHLTHESETRCQGHTQRTFHDPTNGGSENIDVRTKKWLTLFIRKSSYSLVNQPISRHLSGGGGGWNQRTQTKQLGMWRTLPTGRGVWISITERLAVCGGVWQTVLGLPPQACGAACSQGLSPTTWGISFTSFQIVAFSLPLRMPS